MTTDNGWLMVEEGDTERSVLAYILSQVPKGAVMAHPDGSVRIAPVKVLRMMLAEEKAQRPEFVVLADDCYMLSGAGSGHRYLNVARAVAGMVVEGACRVQVKGAV